MKTEADTKADPANAYWIVQMSMSQCDKAFRSLRAALEYQKTTPAALEVAPIEVQAKTCTKPPNLGGFDGKEVEGVSAAKHRWTVETMLTINELTPAIKGKAFDVDWFLLRQRFEAAEEKLAEFGQEWDGEKFAFNGKD